MELRFDRERPGDDHRRHPFARPGPRDRVRAARLANGSACRSRRSNTSRATPRRFRSAAARLRRAARWSAERRLRAAADAIIAKARDMAGILMEAAAGDIEFKDGKFTVAGTDKAMPITDVAKAFFAPAGPVAEVRARARGRGHLQRRTGRRAELSKRLPGLRGRGRSGNRRRHDRPLRRGRRSRHDHQSDDLRGTDPRRHCAGRGPGAVRGRSPTIRRPASSSAGASWTTRCRARSTCPTSFPS